VDPRLGNGVRALSQMFDRRLPRRRQRRLQPRLPMKNVEKLGGFSRLKRTIRFPRRLVYFNGGVFHKRQGILNETMASAPPPY
jgi:hypothetical protein